MIAPRRAGRAGRRPPAGSPPRSRADARRRLRLLLRRLRAAAAADAAGGAAESHRRGPLPLRHRRIRRQRHPTGHALAIAIGHVAWLGQLLPIRHDDAHVMFGVLQIVLCKHRVAGSLRIPGERKILLRDMRRRAPDLHIRSVGFEAARQRIVVFPIVITTATAAILLSLPHCPSGSYVTSTCLINAHPANASMVLLAPGLGLADPNSTASDPSIATPSERADPGAPWRRSPCAAHGLSRGNGPSVSLLGDQWC